MLNEQEPYRQRRSIAHLALVLLAFAVPGTAQTWYNPSSFESVPVDPQNGTPVTRPLTGPERDVVDRMVEAAEEYVRRNPRWAPQLKEFRDCVTPIQGPPVPGGPFPIHPGFIRRGEIPGYVWRTLPDYLRVGGGPKRWVEPGGRWPGLGVPGGQILPPNILIVTGGEIDGPSPKCDPAEGCLQRAMAIFTAIHEGFRQGNKGIIEGKIMDCTMLRNVIATFASDRDIWTDLINNGVPIPGQPNCQITNRADLISANRELAGAEAALAAQCAEYKKRCPLPAPDECQ